VIWELSNRFDGDCLPLADRHYSRQKPGTPQFAPPARTYVLKAPGAVWVTSWPFEEYTHHQWAGAWINSMFRKECDGEASQFIREAIAATRHHWPEVPVLGMVSFIDPLHVQPRMVRKRPTWAHCYFKAGFRHVGYTKGGLWAMQILEADMPEAEPPAIYGSMFPDMLPSELATLTAEGGKSEEMTNV
jgi:hypothetical protein